MTISEKAISGTSDNVSSSRNVVVDHNHPLYLYPCDGPDSMSIMILLIGMQNYGLWSQAMKLSLLGKNKLCFVDGTSSKADFEPELDNVWERCNVIVISWIICNVSKQLHFGVLFSSSAHAILSN